MSDIFDLRAFLGRATASVWSIEQNVYKSTAISPGNGAVPSTTIITFDKDVTFQPANGKSILLRLRLCSGVAGQGSSRLKFLCKNNACIEVQCMQPTEKSSMLHFYTVILHKFQANLHG